MIGASKIEAGWSANAMPNAKLEIKNDLEYHNETQVIKINETYICPFHTSVEDSSHHGNNVIGNTVKTMVSNDFFRTDHAQKAIAEIAKKT